MKHKIGNNSLFTKHFLLVHPGGVKFYATSGWGAKRFAFSQIECVLMSPSQRLSFQVGNEVFSIPTKPGDARHRAAIDALLEGVRRTTGGGLAPP